MTVALLSPSLHTKRAIFNRDAVVISTDTNTYKNTGSLSLCRRLLDFRQYLLVYFSTLVRGEILTFTCKNALKCEQVLIVNAI